MTEKRRHARLDAAQAAKGRQKPSTPSMRPPVQPETGTICAGRRSSGGLRLKGPESSSTWIKLRGQCQFMLSTKKREKCYSRHDYAIGF